MISLRYDHDPFLVDLGFHCGMRSSYRLARLRPYLTMMRSVMHLTDLLSY